EEFGGMQAAHADEIKQQQGGGKKLREDATGDEWCAEFRFWSRPGAAGLAQASEQQERQGRDHHGIGGDVGASVDATAPVPAGGWAREAQGLVGGGTGEQG